MLIKNNKIYRNLQEQVLENQKTIQYMLEEEGALNQFGVKVVGTITPEESLPTPEQYKERTGEDLQFGDAIAQGYEGKYLIHIWTRGLFDRTESFWLNVGQFPAPSTVEGPEGPQGPKGATGERGSRWFANKDKPYSGVDSQQWDCALDTSTGDVYQLKKNNSDWELIGNIRGPRGADGLTGPVGPVGPQGIPGPQGPEGPAGQFIELKGELSSTAQLPAPTAVPRSTAYLIPDDAGNNHVWLIGEDQDGLVWVDAGSFGGSGSKVTIDGKEVPIFDGASIPAGSYPEFALTDKGVPYFSKDPDYVNEVLHTNRELRYFNINNKSVTRDWKDTSFLTQGDDIKFVPAKRTNTTYQSTKLTLELAPEIKEAISNSVQKSTVQSVVYGTDGDGNSTLYKAVTTPTGNSVVVRQSNGCIQVPSMPQADTDAVSKKYVDEHSGGGGSDDTFYYDVGMITPVDLDLTVGYIVKKLDQDTFDNLESYPVAIIRVEVKTGSGYDNYFFRKFYENDAYDELFFESERHINRKRVVLSVRKANLSLIVASMSINGVAPQSGTIPASRIYISGASLRSSNGALSSSRTLFASTEVDTDGATGALVQRGANGDITVLEAPISDTSATSKKYVDDQYDTLQAQIDAIDQGGGAGTYYTHYINITKTYTSNNANGASPSAPAGEYQYFNRVLLEVKSKSKDPITSLSEIKGLVGEDLSIYDSSNGLTTIPTAKGSGILYNSSTPYTVLNFQGFDEIGLWFTTFASNRLYGKKGTGSSQDFLQSRVLFSNSEFTDTVL